MQPPTITGIHDAETVWRRALGYFRPIYPDPKTQMKARAPMGILSNRDSNVENPMPLKIIDPNVVTAPLPVLDKVDRRNIHQK